MFRKSVLLTLLSLSFLACSVDDPPACSAEVQQEKTQPESCDFCAKRYIPSDASTDFTKFSRCYDHADSGALVGDGSKCAQANEAGAQQWQDFVQDMCAPDACAAVCCYFCSSEPYGKLAP